MPSEKVLNTKKQIIKELSDKFKVAKGMVFADYRGLTVEQDMQMRTALRKADIEYRVVKNSMTLFAARENGLEALEEYLKGPTSVAISYDDVVAPAKIMSEHAKKFKILELKAGVVEGKIVGLDAVKNLAGLPSKEVLIAQMLGGLNSPITGLANVLNGNIRGLAVALNAIMEQKQQSA